MHSKDTILSSRKQYQFHGSDISHDIMTILDATKKQKIKLALKSHIINSVTKSLRVKMLYL